MNVEIIDCTKKPIDIISRAAGTSYRKTDPSHKRLNHCFKNGHMSVFEFAYFTARIEGISRACSHQLVRHRHASFIQESQRYTKVEGDDWYVIPPSFEGMEWAFEGYMRDYLKTYESALKAGVKPEDARFLLPEATKTNITMNMNVRELFHFLGLRTDRAAQWEIRELANEIKDKMKGVNEQWEKIISLWDCSNKGEKTQD